MNRLKFLREEKGLFQSDIAKFLGVSISAVGFYENEKRDMSPDTIVKLANYFGVSTDYLLGKSDIRNPEKTQEDPLGLAKVGFSMDNYTPPTEKQKEQIRDLLEVILKDNKKEDKKENKKKDESNKEDK